eukprot:gene3018-5028_t
MKTLRSASLDVVGPEFQQVNKRLISEPIIKQIKAEKTEEEREKERAKQIMENQGFSPTKSVSLDAVILILNEEWDEEPDFVLL